MASVEVELGVTPETTYSISGKQLKFDSESDIAPYIKELTEKENGQKKLIFQEILLVLKHQKH